MADIRFYPATELPAHLFWQVRSFIRTHWPFVCGAQKRLRSDFWWDETLAPVHTVLVENEVLISYGAIVRKELHHAGESFATLGLNSVFTFPDFRREGYGKCLVETATRRIEDESRADIGVLFCRPVVMKLYAGAGWEHRDHAVTLVGAVDNPRQVEGTEEKSERRMMLFPSEKGKRARTLFWDRPVYFGESEW